MSWVDSFLPRLDEPIPWRPEGMGPELRARLTPLSVFQQSVTQGFGLEVALAQSRSRPKASDMRDLWKLRRAGRPNAVLLAVRYPDPQRADGFAMALCGPLGESPAVHDGIESDRVERLARLALTEPTWQSAVRLLQSHLPELSSAVAGLRNSGLFATHELINGVPNRRDWQDAVRESAVLLNLRGRVLVERLGFRVDKPLSPSAWMLTGGGTQRAVAVFCDDTEPIDAASQRFRTSPVSLAMALASQHGIDWVLITRASEIRLYSARTGSGVGGKSRAETFVEANLALLPRERAGYLGLLFSAEALDHLGSVHQIRESSERFSAELAVRLRERIYFEAVPALARGVAARMDDKPSEQALADAYTQVLVVLFRLLFVAYAEDMDLLPLRTNDLFKQNSLTELARERLKARNAGQAVSAESSQLWLRVVRLWHAVDGGSSAWGVPAYNGGLFSTDPAINPAGSVLDGMTFSDLEFAPALDAVLLADTDEGEGLVDFRSLSVREFGTIYEGLLESRLSVAEDDLTVRAAKSGKDKGQEQYVPASEGEAVVVPEGQVYLHNRSGVRKATGSYFTKSFAVEHLLDHALTPALDRHLDRLEALREAGDDAGMAAAFFDFRCADIAMGSGHFLVAAVDHIEDRLSDWLELYPIPSVTEELERLRKEASEALGKSTDLVEIKSETLLRRQIARHCVYGIDLQQVAVELARLAIWVHTFVPGLPLSFLDHNLVRGNSLTGVSSLDDALLALEPNADAAAQSLFRGPIQEVLGRSEQALNRLAHTSDATAREIEQAREAHIDAQHAVAPARALFDLVSAKRAGVDLLHANVTFDEEKFTALRADPRVEDAVEWMLPVHYPATFPEVFLRDNPGFDCLLGNPPWEQVVVQEHVWWGMHLPRIRGLPVAQMKAAITRMRNTRVDREAEYMAGLEEAEQLRSVLRSSFVQLGSGRTDLYKAFCWRNWQLIRTDGMVGIVLPRTVLQSAGSQEWREAVIGLAADRSTRIAEPSRAEPSRAEPSRAEPCQSRPASITRGGCSTMSTTRTRSRWQHSRGAQRHDLPQHGRMGLRRTRRALHHRPGCDQQAQRPEGVALTPKPITSASHI